jgi:hypothetical protein
VGSFCLVRLLSGIAAADGVVVLQLAASWEEPGSEQRRVEEPSLALNELAVPRPGSLSRAREILWSALGAPEVPPPAPESVAGCRGPRNLRDVACTPS